MEINYPITLFKHVVLDALGDGSLQNMLVAQI